MAWRILASRSDLFGWESPVGQDLKVNDIWLTVVGVLAPPADGGSFQGVSVGSTALEIYVPYTTALRKFDRDPMESPLSELVVPEALLEQSRKTQRLFNVVMGCIAGISLLVGEIGILDPIEALRYE